MPPSNNDSSSSSAPFGDDANMGIVEVSDHESLHMSGLSRDEEADDDMSMISAPQLRKQCSHSTGLTISTTSSVKTVELVAPADLPNGYQFVATIGGNQEYVVEVYQKNGVYKGQRFQAMIVRQGSSLLRAQPGHFIPFGSWRDGLLDCFRFGMFHSVLCMACWCSPLLLGQVMERMGLNAFGKPVEESTQEEPSVEKTSKSPPVFRTLSALFILHFFLIETVLSAAVVNRIHARQEGRIDQVPTWAYMLLAVRAVCRSALFLYVLVISMRTRRHVRERYGIPEQHLDCGMEDAVIAVTCHPCSAAQLARHTADYASYDAQCCAATGLSSYAPPAV